MVFSSGSFTFSFDLGASGLPSALGELGRLLSESPSEVNAFAAAASSMMLCFVLLDVVSLLASDFEFVVVFGTVIE